MLVTCISASAQTDRVSIADELDGQQVKNVAATVPSSFKPEKLNAVLELKVPEQTITKAEKKPSPSRNKKVAKAGEQTSADISGFYVGTYQTLTSGGFDGGSQMQIVPDAEGDSLTIKDFWSGIAVRAHYDKATATVTIPRQHMFVDTNLGQLDLAVTQSTGAPDYTAKITGKVMENGDIDFSDSWWGLYVQAAGTNKDKFAAAYYNLVLGKPNGTMQYKNSSGAANSYSVIINQTSPNMLSVTNIFNRGLNIEIKLNRDRTAEINNQVALINSNGPYSTIKCIAFDTSGNLTQYSPIITTDVAEATNNNTLKWTDWSLLNAEARSYAGHLTDAVLTADNSWAYPELSVSDFEGEGTVDNPYLISSLDHLILLSDKVNNDNNYIGVTGTRTYSRTYLGKHFALANDIDMKNYSFDAIGNTSTQHFAGSLDGRGHTIKGLNVNGGSSYYAGLFGYCDTVSVIKNVVLDAPVVQSTKNCAGSLVAWTCGSLENITVKNPSLSAANGGNGGVAGIVLGKIENCHVVDGVVMGSGFHGGLVGEVHGGIHNCSVTGTRVYITGDSSPAGGVAGNILDADGSDLSFSGLMTYANLSNDNGQIIGGVAGVLQNVALRNSFSSGVVRGYSAQSQLGGVVGIMSSGTLENCYSSGNIHCYSRMAGGLIGQIQMGSSKLTPKVTNCYTSATVEVETYQYDRNNCNEVIGKILDGVEAELTNVYYDKKVTDFGSTRFGTTTAALTSATGPAGFSSDVWTFTAGAYPRIKSMAETEASKFSASAVLMGESDSFKKISNNTPLTALGNTVFAISKGTNLYTEGNYSKIKDNNMLEIGTEFGVDTLYVVNGNVQTYHFINIAPIPFEGAGTADAPFLIKTKADMIALSEATTVKRQMFNDMYFEMTNDIDMEHDPAFDGINADETSSAASIKFQGVFDGKGHTLNNVLINRVAWSTAPTETTVGTLNTTKCRSMGGVFGRLGENGIIRNLNIGAGSKFEMFGNSAAVAGSVDGLIENCRNYADVTGYSCWVGSMAGQLNKGGRIVNCYNAGNIRSGYANVGGIAGTTYGIIENCVNTGDVFIGSICTNFNTQRQRAGGITGGCNGGDLKNCVNFGTVYAEKNNVGGIAGSMDGTSTSGSGNNNLVSCANFGNVYCGNPATTGAVLGLKGTKNVQNVYFDAQTIGVKAGENTNVDNIVGMETADLISGQPIEGLSADIWDYQAGMYPTLKSYADEAKAVAARKVIAKAATGEIFTELLNDVELGENATWSLVDGTTFKIENGKLIVPKNVSEIVTDTLVAVNGANVRRPMFVQALPSIPLTGEGTEANPYIISNTDEWNALATYIDKTGKTLEGQFVKITADLDFTGKTPARIGADGVTPLAATLDGDNHTIKGLALTSKANSSCGLFGTIDVNGTVKNLILEGKVNGTYTFATVVADKLYGTLENIVSKVDVTTNKASVSGVVGNAYTGALLKKVVYSGTIESNQTSIGGLVATGAAGVTYQGCEFNGKIKHTASYTKATDAIIGGLVAVQGASTFTDCKSAGEITVASTAWAKTVAGFIGNALGAKDNGLYTFTSCSNSTPVTAGGKIAGFIAGGPTTSSAAANAQYVMTDCYNTADITAKATKAMSSCPTGGLVTFFTPGSSFTRCYNTGTITSDFNVYAAGIAGYTQGIPGSTSTPAGVEFTDCYNEGNIVANGNQGGGITGSASGKVTFTRCYNKGKIEGVRMLGGITSAFSGNGPQMINCYNTADVTAKEDRAGGLIAWGSPTNGNGLVEGCWNTGNVSSLSTVQSNIIKDKPSYEIAGLAATSGATFKNCYNAGTIKGLARVAGLVATPEKAKTHIINCYNAGKIDAPADSCGSIVGVSITNGKQWTADNKMENTWYLDINTNDHDADFSAKKATARELAALDLGEAFTSMDDYTYPIVKATDNNEVAIFHAAELILAEDDTFDKVTKGFNVGGTPTVQWTSDNDGLTFDGNTAKFVKDFTGKVVVTATVGELTKTYELTVSYTSGIDNLGSDASDVVSRKFFNTAGVEVSAQQTSDGQVYMVVEKLTDGSTRVIKIAKKK